MVGLAGGDNVCCDYGAWGPLVSGVKLWFDGADKWGVIAASEGCRLVLMGAFCWGCCVCVFCCLVGGVGGVCDWAHNLGRLEGLARSH